MLSQLLWNISDSLWGSAANVAPDGSVGDLLFGVLTIPSALVYGLSEVIWGFGS